MAIGVHGDHLEEVSHKIHIVQATHFEANPEKDKSILSHVQLCDGFVFPLVLINMKQL